MKKPAAAPPPFAAPDWPATRIEMWPVGKLLPYARNVKEHDVELIKASIVEYGWTQPVLVDEAGVLLAGHGRVMAARELGLEQLPTMVARGWTEKQKRKYRLLDNKMPEAGGWNVPALRDYLKDMDSLGWAAELPQLGFRIDELKGFGITLPAPGAAGDGDENTGEVDVGSILGLVDVTIKEPRHQVQRGDHYTLHGRHHLVCRGVVADWEHWAPMLSKGWLFCPYPGVFVPFGHKAAKNKLLLVQPDPYIAGHILDRYEEVHGAGAVKQVPA